MKKLYVLITLVLFAGSISAQSNQKLQIEKLQKQVEQLELAVGKLNTTNKEMSQQFEKKVKLIGKEYSIKTEDYKLDIKRKISNTWFLLLSLVIGAVGGVVTLFFVIPKYTNKKVLEEITQLISIKREDILTIIHKNEAIQELKNKKKILVISAKSSSDNELQRFFAHPRFHFKNLSFEIIDNNIEELKKKAGNSDLVILNNQENDFKNYAEFLKSEGKTFFLYYNVTNVRANVTNTRRFNFANSTATLYPRIIETLEVQDAFVE